jgi:xylulokinase
MTEQVVILAVDLGTSGIKTALITAQGQVLGWESEPVHLYLTPDGGAEQSPEEWWQAFLLTSRRLIDRKLVPQTSIKAVCVSTQGEGTIPVDKDGTALMNCVLWMDMRGKESLLKQFGGGLINISGYRLSKVLEWIKVTGGMPSATGKDPASHMLFIRDKFPQIYEKTYKFLNVPDYLNMRLTGRYCASYDSILTSWITDNRNPDDIHYDPALVKGCGIDAEKLPEVVACTQIIGTVKGDVATSLGLKQDVVVVAGSIDTTAAAVGAGAVEDNALHLYLGTSSWMTAHVPYKKTDALSSLASVPCAVPHKYLLIALQATAGGNLTFLRDKILYHKDELLQEEKVPDVFKVIDRIAERVPAGANGVIYTPWIWGERAPVEDSRLRAGLYNLSLNSNRADIIRAFLEGIAFNTRWLLQPVEKFLGVKTRQIRLVGGGGNSDIWCQIFADVMNVDICQVQDPIQANARGAAFIAAVGMKEICYEDVPNLVKFKQIYQPRPENRRLYDETYQTYLDIYKQMKPIYHRMNR